MKKLFLTVAIVLGLAFAANAQQVTCSDGGPCWAPSKLETSGMFAFAFDKTPVSTTFGGGGDVAYFPFMSSSNLLAKNFGLASEFYYTTASYSKTGSENLFTAMAGPRYRFTLGDGWSVFGQSLFGVARENFSAPDGPTATTTRGAYSVGGGLDAQFTQHFSIRFIEYTYEDTLSQQQAHQRISMGLKFSF